MAGAARDTGTTQVLTGFIPVGPLADTLLAIVANRDRHGHTLAEHLRDWDKAIWPHCPRGYFALKKEIPALLKLLA